MTNIRYCTKKDVDPEKEVRLYNQISSYRALPRVGGCDFDKETI